MTTPRTASRVLAPVFVLLLGSAGCASLEHPHAWDEAVRHSRHILHEYIEATGVPALQIAVGVDGEIVWSEAFGSAELSPERPATTDSRFRIASISKLLTGTLTAKLADEGVLDLDRPIGEYVPGLPDAWHDITARMLVHHTSGIPHYADAADALDTTPYTTTRDALKRFEDRPLLYPPGSAEAYSSYAYTVLALAIEQVTGRPFTEVMQDRILDPLRMTHTGPDLRSSPPSEVTAFYNLTDEGKIEPAPEVDLSGRWAGSGYLSTAEDLVRFGMAHTQPGVLSANVLELVGQQQSLPDGTQTKEGFGWGPRSDWDGRRMLWGDGSTPGSRCGLLVYPDDGVAIAILTNLRGLALERGEFQTLAPLFFAARKEKRPVPPAASMTGTWTGTVKVGDTAIAARLVVESGGHGTLAFAGWRTLRIADMYRIDQETWVVALDRDGFFPVTIMMETDRMAVSAPRAGWSFTMTRSGPAGS